MKIPTAFKMESIVKAAVSGEKWAIDVCWKLMEPLLLAWNKNSQNLAPSTESSIPQPSQRDLDPNEEKPSISP